VDGKERSSPPAGTQVALTSRLESSNGTSTAEQKTALSERSRSDERRILFVVGVVRAVCFLEVGSYSKVFDRGGWTWE